MNHLKFVSGFRFFYLIMLYCFSMVICSANANDMALETADKYYKAGNYNAAITEYKRFIYYNPKNELVSDAYYKIGLSYRSQNKWADAIDAMKVSLTLCMQDSIKDERRISIAIIMIAGQNYSAAEFELLKAAHFSKYPSNRKKAFYFLGVCNLYTFKWEKARHAFQKYYSDDLLNNAVDVDSLLQLSNNIKYKSPRFAKWTSTFLPGSGQIYAGDYKDGINALVVNTLTSYLLVNALLERQYVDIILCYLTLFERYYRGNRYHAEKTVKEYNDNLSRQLSQKILIHLSANVDKNGLEKVKNNKALFKTIK
ncbi:MAG: tetratricopeptide repeat protein [Calditrichales bacterium]|nr:tetratricopeptide repeat protein [Calditrichales bacterium]